MFNIEKDQPESVAGSNGAAGVFLWLATVTTGLSAGLLYSFSVAVMVGLAQTDTATYLKAMQRINSAIRNPFFGFGFIGAFVFTAVAAVIHRRIGAREALRWIAAALGLYVVAMAITAGINLPINDRLDAVTDITALVDPGGLRREFEDRWVPANHARALAATLALGCLARALTEDQ